MAGEPPTPAGRIRTAMVKRDWTETHLAWALGFSPTFIAATLEMPSITPQFALRLEAAFDEPAETWMDTQRDLDLSLLRDRMGGELARIRRRAGQPIPDFP